MYFLDKDVPIKLWKPYRMQIMKNALVISETALVCYLFARCQHHNDDDISANAIQWH